MSQSSFALGPDLRAALVAMVRKRVPESEVEDIVQSALAEAVESPNAPQDSESLRRWIFGVAKHKVIDYHRRAGREVFDMPEFAGAAAPHVEADLLRWAERNIPDGDENQKTLDWMIREGEGEKLESIAASEKMPAPRVRQRVSRLRRHLKDNWQREVALLAALGVIVSAVVLYVLRKDLFSPTPAPITHDTPDPRANPIRKLALEKCEAKDWTPCIEGLDEAKRLDPAGDEAPAVQNARAAAKAATPPPPLNQNTAPLPTTAPPPESSERKPDGRPESTAPTAPTPAPPSSGMPSPMGKINSKSEPSLGGSDFGGVLDFGSSGSGGSGTPAVQQKTKGPVKPTAKPAAKPAGTDDFSTPTPAAPSKDDSVKGGATKGSGGSGGGGGKKSASSSKGSDSGNATFALQNAPAKK